MTQRTDHEWVRLLKQDDPDAQDALWHMLYQDGVTIANRFGRSQDDGRQAAIQTYEKIMQRGIHQFRFQSTLRSYCWTILTRELYRNTRNELDLTRLASDPPANPNPHAHYDPDRVWQRLAPCLKRLSPNRRRVFELVDVEGLAPAEAAAQLDMKRNNVNQLAARARRDLRTCLEQRGFKTSDDVLGL